MGDTKFSINDFEDCTITCSCDRWKNHVVVEHPIMSNNAEAVKDTLKDPDAVFQSDQNDDRHVYFKDSDLSTYNATTKVIISYGKGKKNPSNIVGEVVTAFPQKGGQKGGIGDVLYRKTSN